MDMWNPLLLEQLASANYRVIIFENRGVGESTVGTKEFSISQFANDTLGLLDALGISKASFTRHCLLRLFRYIIQLI